MIIPEKDLRIGNLVAYRSDNDNDAVLMMVDRYFFHNYDERNGCCAVGLFIEPLAITEERLLKYGFELITGTNRKAKYVKWFQKHPFDIQMMDGKIFVFKLHDLIYLQQPKYIHELQNVFYYTTGQEL